MSVPEPYVPAPMVIQGTALASEAPLEKQFSVSKSDSSSLLSASHMAWLASGCASMALSRSAPLKKESFAVYGMPWPAP